MPELIQTQDGIKLRAKATCEATKIHGPNSPDVLSGRVPLGHRESIEMSEPEQIVEMTYDQCVEHFGKENADALFKGAVTHE